MKHTTTTIDHPLKSEFMEYLERNVPENMKHVEGYILAGEHQDGKGFWNNFTTVEEIAEDLKMYIEFKQH